MTIELRCSPHCKTVAMDVATALGAYLEIADSVAPGLIEGLYVVGSFALDDWQPGRSDIDIVAVTAEPATDEDFGSLRTVHALLAERQPLPSIDGPYLAWADLIVAPATGLHRPWTLAGDLHHDGECFEINPVTWYTLATYGVTVRGPSADSLNIWLDTEDRVRFVIDNLSTYWHQLAESVEQACHDPDATFDLASFEWCALGALRLHYTAFTGDVTSKRGAGEYGLVVTPDHMHDTLRAALNARATGEGEATSAMMLRAADVIRWTVNEVRLAAA
ncbi:MAG: nucleotidyltransferase domain-containing protein [Ilumatobacteraceae bacterium]